jgi:UDP-N-acetylglucosamine:LPS N-acetylglucosamine transferase
LYSTADAVIGGAGYNIIHECAACQVPLIARPWPRKYDRQWMRAGRAINNGWARIVETPMESAHAAINQMKQPPMRERAKIRNGARDAVALIERKVSSPPATSPVR